MHHCLKPAAMGLTEHANANVHSMLLGFSCPLRIPVHRNISHIKTVQLYLPEKCFKCYSFSLNNTCQNMAATGGRRCGQDQISALTDPLSLNEEEEVELKALAVFISWNIYIFFHFQDI